MLDDQRIQIDVRNLPMGVKPTLKLMAVDAGCTFTDLIRTIVVEYALKGKPPAAPRISKRDIKESGYVPVR